MNMNAFADASVAGIPLVLVVLGLVAWLGEMGVKGKAQSASSLVVGLIFGMGFHISQAIPTTYAGWFAAAVYGIGLGLVGSGIYKVGVKMSQKGMSAAIAAIDALPADDTNVQ